MSVVLSVHKLDVYDPRSHSLLLRRRMQLDLEEGNTEEVERNRSVAWQVNNFLPQHNITY